MGTPAAKHIYKTEYYLQTPQTGERPNVYQHSKRGRWRGVAKWIQIQFQLKKWKLVLDRSVELI